MEFFDFVKSVNNKQGNWSLQENILFEELISDYANMNKNVYNLKGFWRFCEFKMLTRTKQQIIAHAQKKYKSYDSHCYQQNILTILNKKK